MSRIDAVTAFGGLAVAGALFVLIALGMGAKLRDAVTMFAAPVIITGGIIGLVGAVWGVWI